MAIQWQSAGTGHKFVDLGDVVDYYRFPDSKFTEGEVPIRRDVINRKRRMDSMYRARKRVQWLIECNKVEKDSWFFTATFSDDVKDFSSAVLIWEKFRRSLVNEFPNCKYVCVPEVQPVSRRWHFHAVIFYLSGMEGLFKRYPIEIVGGKPLPGFVRWFHLAWSRANGHIVDRDGRGGDRCDISLARSVSACARYVTKYLTKDLAQEVPTDRRCYFSGGRGLKRPIIRKFSNYEPDFQEYQPCGQVTYTKKFEGQHVGRVIYSRFCKSKTCEKEEKFCGCYDAKTTAPEVIPIVELPGEELPWYIF